MLNDWHVHTRFSSDSEADPDAVIRKALSLGMSRICITDHYDMDYPGGEFCLDTEEYLKTLENLRTKYVDKIEICLGVEMGLQPELSIGERVYRYISSYPFDFAIGSVHLVDGKDPYDRKDIDLTDEQLYRRYFELVLENVRKPRGYQALGHLDYVVRYGYSKAENYSYEKYEDLIDSILMELINRQIALEVNTAGLRGGLGFPNPHPDIIRRYHNLGGDLITVGSDAHSPEDVGYGMAQVRELLLDLGIHYVTEYRQKKPVMVHL